MRTASAVARAAVLIYGSLVYLFFLPTFLYAIGFVGGFGVPKSLDSGRAGPVGTALLVNAGLLGLFAVQHMVMARPGFKRRWTRVVPQPAERSTFVLFACVALCLMYVLWRPIPGVVWSVEQPGLALALQVLSLSGWALVLVSTFLIDHFDLFGLKQVVRFAVGRPYAEPAFKVAGMYRHVRHPLYLGFLVAFWATPTMTWGHLLLAAGTTGFILVAVRLEERDLRRAHREYEGYSAAVPMLVPRLRRGRLPARAGSAR